MRDLLNQDRPLTPDMVRLATTALSALFGVAGLIITLHGLMNLFGGGTFLIGLLQITGGLGLMLALFLIVRLLADGVMALHRINDRLTIQADAAKPRQADSRPAMRAPAASAAQTKPANKAKPASKAKTATKPAERPDVPNGKPGASPATKSAEN